MQIKRHEIRRGHEPTMEQRLYRLQFDTALLTKLEPTDRQYEKELLQRRIARHKKDILARRVSMN